MLSSGATLGAPPRPEHTHLQGWLARTASRTAVLKEMTAMLDFVKSLQGTS